VLEPPLSCGEDELWCRRG